MVSVRLMCTMKTIDHRGVLIVVGRKFLGNRHFSILSLFYSRLVWLGVIESREWEFRDKSSEIFYLFCKNESFGGKGNGSLEDQLPLINSLGEEWEFGGVVLLIKEK